MPPSLPIFYLSSELHGDRDTTVPPDDEIVSMVCKLVCGRVVVQKQHLKHLSLGMDSLHEMHHFVQGFTIPPWTLVWVP